MPMATMLSPRATITTSPCRSTKCHALTDQPSVRPNSEVEAITTNAPNQPTQRQSTGRNAASRTSAAAPKLNGAILRMACADAFGAVAKSPACSAVTPR